MTRRINLVPPSERPRTTTDVGLLLMLVLTIVVVFGLGFGYYLLSGQLADKEQELADLEQQVAGVEAQVAALRQYEVVKIQRDEMEAVVAGHLLGAHHGFWHPGRHQPGGAQHHLVSEPRPDGGGPRGD